MIAVVRSETAARRGTRRRVAAAVWVLLGLAIVAHGCHADRDTELRARPAASR
jgi:hypothetical protein